MFTLNSLLAALADSGKIQFQGEHYTEGSAVWTGDLWRIWPSPNGLESEKQDRLRDAMEKRNMQLRFADETITDENGKVHELNPGYYGQTPTFKIIGCTVWTQDEALEHTADYIDAVMSAEPVSADRWLSSAQLEEQGFVRFDYDAESGFHPGQTDTPDSVKAKFLEEHGLAAKSVDILFHIDDVGQFDVDFSLWYRKKEEED